MAACEFNWESSQWKVCHRRCSKNECTPNGLVRCEDDWCFIDACEQEMKISRNALKDAICGKAWSFCFKNSAKVYGCTPTFLKGAIRFQPQNEIDNCSELVKQGMFNSNSMTCSCTKCYNCARGIFENCDRTRMYCQCDVEFYTLPDLTTIVDRTTTQSYQSNSENATSGLENLPYDTTISKGLVTPGESSTIVHRVRPVTETIRLNVTTATKRNLSESTTVSKEFVSLVPSSDVLSTVLMTASTTKYDISPPLQSRNPQIPKSYNVSTGAIVGGAIGGSVAVLLLLAFIAALLWRNRRKKKGDQELNVQYSVSHCVGQEENHSNSIVNIPEETLVCSHPGEKAVQKSKSNSDADANYSVANNAYMFHEAALGTQEIKSRPNAEEKSGQDDIYLNQIQQKINETDVVYENTQLSIHDENNSGKDDDVYNHLHEDTTKATEETGEYGCLGNQDNDYGDFSRKTDNLDVDDTYDHTTLAGCFGNPESDYGDMSGKFKYPGVDDTYDHTAKPGCIGNPESDSGKMSGENYNRVVNDTYDHTSIF